MLLGKEVNLLFESNSLKGNEQPVESEDEKARQSELIDIQKELEAKFDELFGSIDSED